MTASVEKGRVRGWPIIQVLGAVVSTSLLAYVFATSPRSAAASQEYSSPSKFVQPKYASIRDMETVSSKARKPFLTSR